MYNLGTAYFRGDGVRRNIRTAKRYLAAAAKLGEVSAIRYLKKWG